MIYSQSLTIPKNTPATAPGSATLPVHPGVMKQVDIYLPPGCAGLVGVRVLYWEHQLFPSNPDSWFTGDGALISFPEDFDLLDAPFELTVEGYNEDDTYEHTPIVRVQMTPLDRDIRRLLFSSATGPTGPRVLVGG